MAPVFGNGCTIQQRAYVLVVGFQDVLPGIEIAIKVHMPLNRKSRLPIKSHFTSSHWAGRVSPTAAFTFTELVVVLAAVAVLLLLQVPAWARAKALSRREQCAGNLRQFAQATQNFAIENNSILPKNTFLWLWVLQVQDADALMRYGASRNTFFCPANPDQNVDGIWNFSLPLARVIGYATTFGGMLNATNVNVSILPQANAGASYSPPDPGKRVLLADATLQSPSGLFTSVPGGYNAPGWSGHRTSHLAGTLPSGGNLTMLDGHVEWRGFSLMVVRSDRTVGPPYWWW